MFGDVERQEQDVGEQGAELVELEERERVERRHRGEQVEVGLVEQAGRGKATHYHVPPRLLRQAGLDGKTTLVRVQPHRLRALILEDLERYPASALTDVRRRVGPEIPERTFRRAMDALVADGDVTKTGEHRWRRYSAAPSLGQGGTRGR